MQIKHLLFLAAIGSTIAKPVPNTELTVFSVRSNPSELFRREAECSTINEIVEAIGTSNSKVVYTVSASVMALSVCQLLRNHGVGGIGTDDCGPITGIVAGGFAIIFQATGSSSEAEPEGDTSKRDVSMLAERLKSAFALDHLPQYDTIQQLDPVTTDEEIPMLEHAIVSGVRHGNTTMDMVFADFGNGNGQIRLQAPANDSISAISKRDHSGPGFKISYTSRLRTQLTTAHQQQASLALADEWARRANNNGIGDFTGFQETGHTSNFYYRIIAEDRSFGSGYESVDYPCGGMAWAL